MSRQFDQSRVVLCTYIICLCRLSHITSAITLNGRGSGLRAARTKWGGCVRRGLPAIRGTPCVATPPEHLPCSAEASSTAPQSLVWLLCDLSPWRSKTGQQGAPLSSDQSARQKLISTSVEAVARVSRRFRSVFSDPLAGEMFSKSISASILLIVVVTGAIHAARAAISNDHHRQQQVNTPFVYVFSEVETDTRLETVIYSESSL